MNGTLYGTTAFGGVYGGGTVFAIDPDTGVETVSYAFCSQQDCTDGKDPSGLLNVNDMLYGTTRLGGTNTDCDSSGCGTVFALDPGTGHESVLHSFPGSGADGELPGGDLLAVKRALYGVTGEGGAYGGGVVFAITR